MSLDPEKQMLLKTIGHLGIPLRSENDFVLPTDTSFNILPDVRKKNKNKSITGIQFALMSLKSENPEINLLDS